MLESACKSDCWVFFLDLWYMLRSQRVRLGASVSDGKLCIWARNSFSSLWVSELYHILFYYSVYFAFVSHGMAWFTLMFYVAYSSHFDFALFFDCNIQQQHTHFCSRSRSLSLSMRTNCSFISFTILLNYEPFSSSKCIVYFTLVILFCTPFSAPSITLLSFDRHAFERQWEKEKKN